MNTKLISYDLNKSGQDYDSVIKYIQSLGDWAKPLRSQFLVKTDVNDLEIVEGMQANGVDANDAILVVDVTNDTAAWAALPSEVSEWIKEKM